jgi:Lrp/AsnC family transcriptional regulator for asnA, asnC and gidA
MMHNRKKLDQIDAKILKILLKEARTSFTDIAEECKITIGAVRMRYKNMIKAGIINGQIMQINPQSLGYKCIADIVILKSIDNEKIVLDFLKTRPYVQHIIGLFGKYNIGVKVALKDVKQLTNIIEDLESNVHIRHVDAMIWAEAINMDHNENLVIKPLPPDEPIVPTKAAQTNSNEEITLDKKDHLIAKILTDNARIPFKKIAEQLGISTKNVIQRYKRLRGNLLTLSSITVDLNKLGNYAMAHNFIKVGNRSKMPEVYASILSIPNVVVVVRLIGTYDLFAIAVLENFEDEFNLRASLRKIPDIERTDTFLNPTFKSYPLNIFSQLI